MANRELPVASEAQAARRETRGGGPRRRTRAREPSAVHAPGRPRIAPSYRHPGSAASLTAQRCVSSARRATDAPGAAPRCPAVTPAAPQLLNVLEQRGGTQVERPCELRDRSQSGLAACTLEQRDLGSVQAARVTEGFLREARGETSGPEVRRELRYRIHRVGCSTPADKTSTDNKLHLTRSKSYCLRSAVSARTPRNPA